jgi:hypothetical protein
VSAGRSRDTRRCRRKHLDEVVEHPMTPEDVAVLLQNDKPTSARLEVQYGRVVRPSYPGRGSCQQHLNRVGAVAASPARPATYASYGARRARCGC